MHPLIPLAVLKQVRISTLACLPNCAPTYTACGIETSVIELSKDKALHCAPTYTACGIETTSQPVEQYTLTYPIVHPLIPLAVLKLPCVRLQDVTSFLRIVHPLIPLAVLKHSNLPKMQTSLISIVHPLIPLAVLKPCMSNLININFSVYCAPTYTACGIETSL